MGPRLLKKKPKAVSKNEQSIFTTKLAIARKRLIRMERRFERAQNMLASLEEEKRELLERNSQILESFQAQKLEVAARQREALNWQKLYHNASVTVNAYEMKLNEIGQGVTSSLKDFDLIFPILVSLSETLVTNKEKVLNVRRSLGLTGQDQLPRFNTEGLSPDNSTKRNLKPAKHRVGPMVRGMLITKPQIILERLMLPQQQDPEQENHAEGVVELTPIQEEEEDREAREMALRNVSERTSKRRLGRGRSLWRLNNKKVSDPLTKDKERLAPTVDYSSSSDSSESDSDHPSLARGHMEPVVRIRDVSRLLQNSSLIKVETEQNVNGTVAEDKTNPKTASRKLARTKPTTNREDPLEGSSWMYQNRQSHPSLKRNQPESSSDFSDEDNPAEAVETKTPLYPTNSTFLMPRKSLFSSSQKKRSEMSSENNSYEAEPDSTNNIEIHMSNNSEDANSSSSSVDSLSRSYPDSKHQTPETNNLRKITIVPMTSSTPFEPTVNNSLCSRQSFPPPHIDIAQVDTREKRVRKPKKIFDPGENELESKQEKKSRKKSVSNARPKLSLGRKSDKNKRSTSLSRKSLLDKDTNDEKPIKKSTSKLSLVTPRNSSISNSLSDFPNASRSSRRKPNVSYKEPPLNKKMRKP